VARSRRISVFSLSFLDVMSCGFGAVVLIFLIINHASERDTVVINDDLLAEIRMLDYQVQNGERDLVELIEQLEDTRRKVDREQQRLISTQTSLERQRKDLAQVESLSRAQVESLEALKSDIESREQEVEQLQALEDAQDGTRIVRIEGEGNRQYLTGLRVGGEHIVIALDASASMLDDTIVNVLRRRNMPDERKQRAPKWQRAVRTVDWIVAQIPLQANFQVLLFNTDVRSVTTPDGFDWAPVGDGSNIRKSLAGLRDAVPDGGTSLENLFLALREMSPLPDNVYLITDSLPTQGSRPPRKATISGKDRLELFRDARVKLPNQIPVNVIMFPMEGDPFAAGAFWNLARATGGAFLAPSRDWP
jgi:hypothetical protein